MKMKQRLSLLLSMTMLLTLLSGCSEPSTASTEDAIPQTIPVAVTTADEETPPMEETVPVEVVEADPTPGIYTAGEKMEDFTVTTSDGKTLRLYEILETKDLVILNFWATWCSPCRQEFPFMEAAYKAYQDDVEIIALSAEDNSNAIEAFKKEAGLTVLPMAYDEIGLSNMFSFSGIPTSVAIDRFGVVCWQETGAITDPGKFQRLFDSFLGDDYTESKAGYKVPGPKSTVSNPTDEALTAALCAEGSDLVFTSSTDPHIWPFIPNGSAATNSCTGIQEATAQAITTVTAKEGDVLAFDYNINAYGYATLILYVDGQPVQGFSGRDAGTSSYRFEEDGTYEVIFAFQNDKFTPGVGYYATLGQVRLVTGDEADVLAADIPAYPRSTGTLSAEIIPLEAKAAVVYSKDDPSVQIPNYLFIAQEDADQVTFRARLGKNQLPAFAQYSIYPDYYYLTETDYDQEGFYITVPLDGTAIMLFLPDYDTIIEVAVCQEGNFATDFIEKVYGEEYTWAYEEDVPLSSAAPKQYQLTFQDTDGNPIPGVSAQLCTDEICNVQISDPNGKILVNDTSNSYEVHVMKAPDPYEIPQATYTLSPGSSRLTITLKNK